MRGPTIVTVLVIILIAAFAGYSLRGAQGAQKSAQVAEKSAPEPFRDCTDCPSMVVIPAGTFMMGSIKKDAIADGMGDGQDGFERPRHSVKIKSFSLGVNEVTRAQYEAFVAATGYAGSGTTCSLYEVAKHEWVFDAVADWRDPHFAQDGTHPVVCVSWKDAHAYARWLSQKTGKTYRLPNEAEWEYAARAGTTTSAQWGALRSPEACRNANGADQAAKAAFNGERLTDKDLFTCNDGYVFTAPVGTFAANAFGLHDMLGNVWEMIEDCWHESYDKAPTDGSAWMEGMYCNHVHIRRGGSWQSFPVELRSAFRNGLTPSQAENTKGFRVARDN